MCWNRQSVVCPRPHPGSWGFLKNGGPCGEGLHKNDYSILGRRLDSECIWELQVTFLVYTCHNVPPGLVRSTSRNLVCAAGSFANPYLVIDFNAACLHMKVGCFRLRMKASFVAPLVQKRAIWKRTDPILTILISCSCHIIILKPSCSMIDSAFYPSRIVMQTRNATCLVQ